MQISTTHPVAHNPKEKQRQYSRIERQYSSQRRLKEFVLDLLRAHSGE